MMTEYRKDTGYEVMRFCDDCKTYKDYHDCPIFKKWADTTPEPLTFIARTCSYYTDDYFFGGKNYPEGAGNVLTPHRKGRPSLQKEGWTSVSSGYTKNGSVPFLEVTNGK